MDIVLQYHKNPYPALEISANLAATPHRTIMRKITSFRIDDELHQKLKTFADSQGITTSQLIELACYHFMEEQPKEVRQSVRAKEKKIEKILLDVQFDQPAYKQLAEIARAKNSTLSQEVYYRVSASLNAPVFDTAELIELEKLHFDLNRLGNLFKMAINNKMPVELSVLDDIKNNLDGLAEAVYSVMDHSYKRML